MHYLLLIAIAALGMAAVVILELNYKDGPIIIALRAWQSFLGALLGLIALAFSIALTERANRSQAVEEREMRGKQIALALHAEITPLAMNIRRAAQSAATGTKVAKERLAEIAAFDIGKVTVTCSGGREIFGSLAQLGVFDANRSNIGSLPGELSYQFVRIHATWRELADRIANLPSTLDCTQGERQDLKLIEAHANAFLAHLVIINREMKLHGFKIKDSGEHY